jgi:hypothetical protein
LETLRAQSILPVLIVECPILSRQINNFFGKTKKKHARSLIALMDSLEIAPNCKTKGEIVMFEPGLLLFALCPDISNVSQIKKRDFSSLTPRNIEPKEAIAIEASLSPFHDINKLRHLNNACIVVFRTKSEFPIYAYTDMNCSISPIPKCFCTDEVYGIVDGAPNKFNPLKYGTVFICGPALNLLDFIGHVEQANIQQQTIEEIDKIFQTLIWSRSTVPNTPKLVTDCINQLKQFKNESFAESFRAERVVRQRNKNQFKKQAVVKQAKKCVAAISGMETCTDQARVVKIPRGFLFFTGCKNKSANDFKNHGVLALIGKQSDDSVKRKKAFILFATASITDATKNYGEGGGILVTQAQTDLLIYKFSSISCDPYFQGPADYDSDAAQCFCQKGLNGYANGVYHEQSNPFALDDIAICDAANRALLKPIGFIAYPYIGTDAHLLRAMQPIDNSIDLAVHQSQLNDLRLLHQSQLNDLRLLKFKSPSVARKRNIAVPAKNTATAVRLCYCLRCRKIVKPQSAIKYRNASRQLMLKGKCPSCGARVAAFCK